MSTQPTVAHTAGPWRLEKYVGEWFVRRPSPQGMPTELNVRLAQLEIARVSADHSNPQDDGHANARLIAAAPDLLAALEQITTALNDVNAEPYSRVIKARSICAAAIAKATT